MFLLWDPIDCTQKIKESSGSAPADHLIATYPAHTKINRPSIEGTTHYSDKIHNRAWSPTNDPHAEVIAV